MTFYGVIVYDFACVLTLFIIYFHARNREYDYSQKIFLYFTLSVQIFLANDGLAWLCQANLNPVTVVLERILMSFQFAIQGIQGLLWMLYADVYINNGKGHHKAYIALGSIQILFSTILIILNVFTGCIFTITLEDSYQRSDLYIANYALYAIYIISILTITIKSFVTAKNPELKTRFNSLVIGVLIATAGYIGQFLFMGLNLVSPGITTAILITYLFGQMPHIEDIKIEAKKNLEAKTFGNFELLYKDQNIKFKRSKSLELVAYLIDRKGHPATLTELYSVLWDDRSDDDSTKSLLRNIISDVKNTFKDLEMENFFIKEYNTCKINPDLISCDFFDYLAGDKNAVSSYTGEYMTQYSWARPTEGYLESTRNTAK